MLCTKKCAQRTVNEEVCARKCVRGSVCEEVCAKCVRGSVRDEVCTKKYVRVIVHKDWPYTGT